MVKKLLDRANELLADGDVLREQYRVDADEQGQEQKEDVHVNGTRWLRSCEHFFDVALMPTFEEKFREITAEGWLSPWTLARLVGIVQSARDELEKGFMFKIKHLVHADLFDSLVGQAEALLEEGHRIASGVMGRIVIEQWLGDEAEKTGIALSGDEKASAVNDRLKKEGVFSKPKWFQIQGLLAVGNSAAHGKTDEFEDGDVRRMLEFIRANCS